MRALRKTKPQIESLQVLRAVAALGVFFFHYFQALLNDFGVFQRNLFLVGAYGVDIFFVVSGFIICLAGQNESSPSRFFVNRMCRILPLYYVLTIGLFFVALSLPQLLNSTTADPIHLIKSLLFIPFEKSDGLVQPLLYLGWTLNYEMFFYLVFSFAIFVGSERRIFVVVGVLLACVILGVIFKPASVVLQFFSSGIMLNFIWGCLAFLIFQHKPEWVSKLGHIWLPAALVIILQNFWPLPFDRQFAIGIPAMFLLIGMLNIHCQNNKAWKFGTRLGDASYSLYLIHPYILQLAIKVALPLFGVSLLSISVVSISVFILTIIISLLMFKLIEKPSNQLLRRYVSAKFEFTQIRVDKRTH